MLTIPLSIDDFELMLLHIPHHPERATRDYPLHCVAPLHYTYSNYEQLLVLESTSWRGSLRRALRGASRKDEGGYLRFGFDSD